LGIFLCASLRDQFEFIMSQWINDGLFAPGLGRTKDPLIGAHQPETSSLTFPGKAGEAPQRIAGFRSFVRTRGAAYCFLPSRRALALLAAGKFEGGDGVMAS
jgi:hypothetical protein